METGRLKYYRERWRQGHLLFHHPVDGDWTSEERQRRNQTTPPAQFVELVVEQTGCSLARAQSALTTNGSDVVLAIIEAELGRWVG